MREFMKRCRGRAFRPAKLVCKVYLAHLKVRPTKGLDSRLRGNDIDEIIGRCP